MLRPVLILMLVAAAAPAAEKDARIAAKLALKKDQQVTYIILKRQVYARGLNNRSVVVAQRQRFTVNKVTQDGFDVRLDFTAAYYKESGPRRNFKYNSTTARGSPPRDAAFTAGPTGQHLRVTISRNGKVTKVQNADKVVAQTKKFWQQAEPVENDSMRLEAETWNRLIGAEAFQKSLQDMISYLPRQEITVGSEWANESQVVEFYRLRSVNQWKVQKVARDTFKLAQTAKLSPHAENRPVHFSWGGDQGNAGFRVSVEYKLEGTRNGEHIIDRRTGLPRLLHCKNKLTGDMSFSFGNKPSVQKIEIEEEEIVVDEAYAGKLQLPAWARIKFVMPGKLTKERTAALTALVRQLGAEDFKSRGKARRELQKEGVKILSFLEKYEDDPDPEIRTTVRKLIRDLTK